MADSIKTLIRQLNRKLANFDNGDLFKIEKKVRNEILRREPRNGFFT